MDKLKEMWIKLVEKFKSFSKAVRIAFIIAIITTIIALASVLFYSSANKYQVLFSNLESNDALLVSNALKEKGVDMKVEGNSILVDREMVDELRLELAPELSGGSKGYELMDSTSSFGMTDEEFQIKKLRMLQGELERTIKSFEQIENARVHITQATSSVFVEDRNPGKAAVYLKLVPGAKITNNQVSSIVALVSGSLSNTPKENIEIIDDNMILLTAEINDDSSSLVGAEDIQKQHQLEKEYEKELEDTIIKLLEPVLGKDKTSVSVKATLDFDSKKYTETIIDPNKVIVSQQTIYESNNADITGESNSPVDNNMTTEVNESSNNDSNLNTEQNTNYESGRKESQVIAAPGEVERLTASVFVDGVLNDNLQNAIESAVGTAIGFDTERGDEITVIGMVFDPTIKEEKEQQKQEIQNMLNAPNRSVIYYLIGAIILGLLIIMTFILIKSKKKSKKIKEEEPKGMLDIVIDDKIGNVKDGIFDLEEKDEKVILEEEIKKYAKDKPEQVVDIIKSWLSENER